MSVERLFTHEPLIFANLGKTWPLASRDHNPKLLIIHKKMFFRILKIVCIELLYIILLKSA